MRSRIFGALAFSALISWAMSACTSAGVSFVYMAIDTGGAQPRQTFYTDSTGVFCIAKYSAARQDATLDFVINQLTGSPWCSPSKVDTTDIHPVFWNGELTPGKGVESVAAMQLLATGMPIVHPCNGYCAQNLPAGNLCKGTGATAGSAACEATYESLGADSCGLGLTCCESLIPGGSSSGTGLSTVPFPAGTFVCHVLLDGVEVGSTPFTIEYPPGNCPVSPPVDGVPCYNWVPEGSKCAGNGVNVTCTCGESGVWSCVK